MTVFFRSFVALALCAGGLGAAAAARADELTENTNAERAMNARVGDLEAEIAALRQQMNGTSQGAALGAGYGDGSAGCCDSGCCGGCEPCCDCCCTPACCCPRGWYAGGEFIMMQPRWKGFDAFTVTTLPAPAVVTLTTVGHDYDYEPTARFFAGYTGCNGLGVRGSWWEFDHDSNPIAFVVPPGSFASASIVPPGIPAGFTLAVQQSLELQTFDLEATNCFETCGGNVVVGFGARYVQAKVQTREQVFDPAGVLAADGEFSDRFEGVGPTLAMEFYRPLCFTGWSLYGNLRGTIAFGEQKESARGGFVGAPAFGSRVADEPELIYELQVALQYCRCGWFVRGGWQAQYWDDLAGDETALGSIGRGIGVPASNTRSDLGMQGFFVAGGLQY